jgi:hypothetical protein
LLELAQREQEARHPHEPEGEAERRARRLPHGPESKDGRFGEGKEKAWQDSRVGKENREVVGANCVLKMKIILLHPNKFI